MVESTQRRGSRSAGCSGSGCLDSGSEPCPVVPDRGVGCFCFHSRRREEPAHRPDRDRGQAGFTLLELMIVMVIIGILAAFAVPSFTSHVRHAREAVLHEDLHVLRSAIDSYTIDKQKAPQALEDLVQAGYLKAIPVDPITHRTDTWITATSDTLSSIDQTDQGGIDDVHSGAQGTSTDGSSYNTW